VVDFHVNGARATDRIGHKTKLHRLVLFEFVKGRVMQIPGVEEHVLAVLRADEPARPAANDLRDAADHRG